MFVPKLILDQFDSILIGFDNRYKWSITIEFRFGNATLHQTHQTYQTHKTNQICQTHQTHQLHQIHQTHQTQLAQETHYTCKTHQSNFIDRPIILQNFDQISQFYKFSQGLYIFDKYKKHKIISFSKDKFIYHIFIYHRHNFETLSCFFSRHVGSGFVFNCSVWFTIRLIKKFASQKTMTNTSDGEILNIN